MTSTRNLATLVELREREVERLTSDVAQKERVRQRYLGNLERMQRLCPASAEHGSAPVALSVNRANYKASVLCAIEQHRQDLTLHEADLAVSQRALLAASRRRELLGQVLARRLRALAAEQVRREQKGQDELASQAWGRTRKFNQVASRVALFEGHSRSPRRSS